MVNTVVIVLKKLGTMGFNYEIFVNYKLIFEEISKNWEL